jgi:hypothetical protein
MLSVTVNPCDKAPPFMLNAHERHINDEIKKKWDLGASLSIVEIKTIPASIIHKQRKVLQDPRARAQGGNDSATKHSHFAHSLL